MWVSAYDVMTLFFSLKSVSGICPELLEIFLLDPPALSTLEALPKSMIWHAGLMRELLGFSLQSESPYGP